MLTRREFLGTSAAGLGALAFGRACRPGTATPDRPNFLFVVTDDQRADALGCAGNPIIRTPNLDRLAGEGIRFERAFVTTPICAASRASILTGTYERTHTYTFTKPPLARAFTDISFPVRLRQAGYRTGFVGKFGVAVEQGVQAEMFDFTRFDSLPHIQTIEGVERHMTEVEGEEVVEFLRSVEPGRPFCLLWCPWAPHADDDNPKQYFWPPAVDELYKDVRFTAKNKTVYAICLDWPERDVLVKALGLNEGEGERVGAVSMLGSKDKIQWRQAEEGLSLSVPNVPPVRNAVVYKVDLK